MDTHDFGQRSGLQVGPVSLGGMRFPPNTRKAVDLVRHAIDQGLRYIDTSRGYGESEYIVGRALRDGYRDRVLLSTKWAPWIKPIDPDDDTSAAAVRRRIEEQLVRLDVERVDFYQVWSLGSLQQLDQVCAPGGTVDGIRKAREDGLVGHLGMTSHIPLDDLYTRLDALDWVEALLLSFNLMNRKAAKVLRAAHERGIATLVMNPVGGGALAEPSPVLADLAREAGAESVPDLAVRYVVGQPYIDTLLCGAHRPEDVDATVASARRGPLDAAALARVDERLDSLAPEEVGFCTACKYCMPCPEGINIPAVMQAVYRDRYWGLHKTARQRYRRLKGPKAEACTRCGTCVTRCTQHLDIPAEMAYAAEAFAEEESATP